MSESTGIAWTDHTFNPWWGCVRVSAACDHCYAETFARRVGFSESGSKPELWGKGGGRRFFGDSHWAEPLKWDRAAEASGRPALVFCASMADVFEGRADLDEPRARLWALIEATPHLVWQLLTKRPEQVPLRVPHRWMFGHWPANAWIGTTVEDQPAADLRIPRLLHVPAPVRFLSVEPLLGPVDLAPWVDRTELRNFGGQVASVVYSSGIGWVIVGGESGPGFRALDVDHVSEVRRLSELAGIPFFFKQWGGRTPTAGGHLLDGEVVREFPTAAQR